MNIIGRKKEIGVITRCLESRKPEFLAIYGRRRTGKTYLVKEYFNHQFAFYTTGILDVKTRGQLKAFKEALVEYGHSDTRIPADWFEAFSRLKELLEKGNVKRDPLTKKKVVFLDELPWMDTARSDFKSALDYFWNSWGSSQSDLLLIVCGSATSWIINNIVSDHGGFYNRVTKQIHLQPFTLGECEELLRSNRIELSRHQTTMCYMVFGGIPYYLNLLDSRLSLAQNIDELIFNPDGELHYEFERLFKSLFAKAEIHTTIIEALGTIRKGMTRNEIIEETGLRSSNNLTVALMELEQSGFVRRYQDYASGQKRAIYQLIDPFTLFHMSFVKNGKIVQWTSILNTPQFFSWSGNAFEIVCLNHLDNIRKALGILGVSSAQYGWKSKKSNPGAQIDLVIDRADEVINICEMKYSEKECEISASYETNLLNKISSFRNETETKKAIHLTFVTINGLKKNIHSEMVVNSISAEDFFS